MISTSAIFDGVMSVILPSLVSHVLADDHAVHAAVLGLHQAVVIAAEIERADHLQRVERELLEILAIAMAVGPHAGAAPPEPPGTNGERMSWSA